jgi:hypothetical protein
MNSDRSHALSLGLIVVFSVLFSVETAGGRQTTYRPGPTFKGLPGIVQPQVDALGARAQIRGYEFTRLTGEYMAADGQRWIAQVLHQLPNLVKLSGFTPGGRDLNFDGSSRPSGLTADEQVLLETFVLDNAEGMLASLRGGAAARLLGRGFQFPTKDRLTDAADGYDIYEVSPRISFTQRETPVKFYYFDSNTGLLVSTRYAGSTRSALRVETKFLEWRMMDGSAYPGRIERYEDGRRIFSFVINSITVAPAIDAAYFHQGGLK